MSMITAKMVLDRMEKFLEPNPLIDKLLLDEIIPRFQDHQCLTIGISTTTLWNYVDRVLNMSYTKKIITMKELVVQFELRGFSVEYKTGRTGCWFELTIPPGAE